MENQEFVKLLQDYGDAFGDRKRFAALLKDYFPEQLLKVNLILYLFDMDIHTEIEKTQIPPNVENIKSMTFSDCWELAKVVLPNKLKKIHKDAFYDCKRLKYLDIPTGTIEIEENAFRGSGLTKIRIPDSGNRYKVVRLIGSGGQGEVYEVAKDDERLALKWYFPKTATLHQKSILERLIAKGTPSKEFLWPEDIITQGKTGTLGYIMKLRPTNYYSIDDLMTRKAEPTFAMLCRAAFNLTRGFQALHSRGYSYHDISFGNAFINPDNGSVLICDNDNVTVSGNDESTIRGTPRFMAPEIVVGAAKPSSNTDLYSLAVLLFFMFMLHHPLEGKLEADIKCLSIGFAIPIDIVNVVVSRMM